MTTKWGGKRLLVNGILVFCLMLLAAPVVFAGWWLRKAPTGFDNLTNGFESQAR